MEYAIKYQKTQLQYRVETHLARHRSMPEQKTPASPDPIDEQLMLEYIFFHEEPLSRFKAFLASHEIPILKQDLDETDITATTVFLQDDLDDEVETKIEDFYDEMMSLNEKLIAEQNQSDEKQQVGLAVSLKDGRSVFASVNPDVLNRILTVISHDELGELVDVIADAVENPDDRPLCKR